LFPLDLYVTHTTAWLNPIIRQALRFLEPTRYDDWEVKGLASDF